MTWTEKKFAQVKGRRMAYVETGQLDGDPIVFLHGNPTSSYLWRNIIPYATGLGRCIAPDLVGMGDSEKLPDSGPDRYRFVEHREYLHGLLDAIGVNEPPVRCDVVELGIGAGHQHLLGAVFQEELSYCVLALLGGVKDVDLEGRVEGSAESYQAVRYQRGRVSVDRYHRMNGVSE